MTQNKPNDEPTVQQLFDLTGKTAVVTGASGHLGRSLAAALAEAGSRLVVTSRDAERAEEVAESLPASEGVKHLGMVLDHMKNEVELTSDVRAILDRVGRINILVNNGHESCSKDWTDVSGEEFSRQLANATGYFVLARLIRDHAVKEGHPAKIILLGSMYGQVGSYPEAYQGICPASPAAYHTLKGGILHMTRHLAVYWAKDKIRVNCLSPGPFPAPSAPLELIPRLEAKSPMGRIGQPSELKGAVVFLASEASSYMTGQNLVIDGGWTSW